MANDLAKLNRLRVNANKPELKSWKASQSKLVAAIDTLLKAGVTDALPGANVTAAPVTTDPEIAAALKPKEETPEADNDDPPSLADSAMAKNIGKPVEEKKPVFKSQAKLARGLETDQMARQSRLAVQIAREKEKKLKDAEKPKKEKKSKKKDEPKIAGKVDAKKDPEKAARQEQHVKDKKAAREAKKDKPAAPKNNKEFTVADLARELKIDPPVARSKLRRHKDKLAKLYAKGVTEGWTFPNASRDAVTKILKGS